MPLPLPLRSISRGESSVDALVTWRNHMQMSAVQRQTWAGWRPIRWPKCVETLGAGSEAFEPTCMPGGRWRVVPWCGGVACPRPALLAGRREGRALVRGLRRCLHARIGTQCPSSSRRPGQPNGMFGPGGEDGKLRPHAGVHIHRRCITRTGTPHDLDRRSAACEGLEGSTPLGPYDQNSYLHPVPATARHKTRKSSPATRNSLSN